MSDNIKKAARNVEADEMAKNEAKGAVQALSDDALDEIAGAGDPFVFVGRVPLGLIPDKKREYMTSADDLGE